MKFPKFVLASNGEYTAALLDGFVIGEGIQRLEFSTEDENGERRGTVRIMDLDIERARISTDKERFVEIMERMAEE